MVNSPTVGTSSSGASVARSSRSRASAPARQPVERRGAPRRAPPVELPGRLEQFDLRLVPAAGRREDAAVMGTAERGDDVAPPHPLGGGTDPLVRAWDVVDQLAPPEEGAEDLVHGGELGQLAGQERRHRLVAERQPLLDAVDHQVHAAEVRHGQELEVGITEAASDRDRLAGQGLAHLRVELREGPDHQHPAALRPVLARLLEDGAGPRQPSAADGPVAENVAGDPGDHARRPAGGHEIALPAEGGVGALVVGGGRRIVALKISGLAEALQRLARPVLGQGELERALGGCGVAVAQRRPALFDRG
jgi:hypothetical protein